MRCACSLFLRAARAHPARVAIESSEQALTYADVERMAGAAARVLRGRGVQRGSVVATCVAEGHLAIVTQLAILLAGTRPVRAARTARRTAGAAIAPPGGLSDRPRPLGQEGRLCPSTRPSLPDAFRTWCKTHRCRV